MKLGLAVTYIVDESHGPLLELHLDRVARHTTVPWTIYGSVNRLLPRYRELLERRPSMKLFELPETSLRGMEEHSTYLERLFDIAFDDGATHVAVLHVDSFPVADGWAERMAAHIGGDVAFASAAHINTACLLFPRQFWTALRPRLLWPDDRGDPAWKRYFDEVKPVEHSGMGFGCAARRAGLGWYEMKRTGRELPDAPEIFDDLVLHVRGALRLAGYVGTSTPALRRVGSGPAGLLFRAGQRVIRRVRELTPARLRPLVRRIVPVSVDDRLLFDPARRLEADRMSSGLERLLADPEGYVAELRGRERGAAD